MDETERDAQEKEQERQAADALLGRREFAVDQQQGRRQQSPSPGINELVDEVEPTEARERIRHCEEQAEAGPGEENENRRAEPAEPGGVRTTARVGGLGARSCIAR